MGDMGLDELKNLLADHAIALPMTEKETEDYSEILTPHGNKAALTVFPGLFLAAVNSLPALIERVERLERAKREAVDLIDEINKRDHSRAFNGINQQLHAKLCTVRATLARSVLSTREGECGH